MKATDLMIGDYVFWNWATHKVDFDGDVMTDRGYKVSSRIIKVSSVNEVGITFKSLKDRSQISIKEENLVPIPLTSDILEKNGFKEDFETNGIYWRPDCRKFCIVKELDTWYFAFRVLGEIIDKSSGYICISECNYVHKLQHKLKDLEIEKEVEL